MRTYICTRKTTGERIVVKADNLGALLEDYDISEEFFTVVEE